jgi:protein-S-isoprenylcysteine O-methyltransferase Ste14
LLQKRLDTNEHEKKQKKVILTTSVIILSGLIIAGIDYRYQWSDVPFWMVLLSSLVILTGYFLFFSVMRQNSYASRVVEVQANQKVIETGLYAYIRHPMYLASILIFTFIPFSLGSYYALIPMLLFPFQMNSRIKSEEEILEKGLDGYTEYKKKVKYKIVPLIW